MTVKEVGVDVIRAWYTLYRSEFHSAVVVRNNVTVTVFVPVLPGSSGVPSEMSLRAESDVLLREQQIAVGVKASHVVFEFLHRYRFSWSVVGIVCRLVKKMSLSYLNNTKIITPLRCYHFTVCGFLCAHAPFTQLYSGGFPARCLLNKPSYKDTVWRKVISL